uniref:ATP synthase complex subunit 8 n=1 Tax=Metacrangonyx panousei TaxID=1199244 RepID=K7ZVQ8_9CRUS|nr:ATP synthase F0 subunit 8 [Metacrangonyx panousei]CCI69462.1 ATP synthase F0 subunit 8 [Metacrangonyx panousei]
MPQMAPSLWVFIYVFMCLMVFILKNNLFFLKDKKIELLKEQKFNKSMNYKWQ